MGKCLALKETCLVDATPLKRSADIRNALFADSAIRLPSVVASLDEHAGHFATFFPNIISVSAFFLGQVLDPNLNFLSPFPQVHSHWLWKYFFSPSPPCHANGPSGSPYHHKPKRLRHFYTKDSSFWNNKATIMLWFTKSKMYKLINQEKNKCRLKPPADHNLLESKTWLKMPCPLQLDKFTFQALSCIFSLHRSSAIANSWAMEDTLLAL